MSHTGSRSPRGVNYPYDFIEQWWGEPLTGELSDRISHAPLEHLEIFANDLRDVSDKVLEVPILPDGILRPVLRSARTAESLSHEKMLSVALNTLLYSQQIIIDLPVTGEAELIPEGMRRLLALKPLVDAGSLYIGHASVRSRHPSIYRRRWDYESVISTFQTHFPELSTKLISKPSRGRFFLDASVDSGLTDVLGDSVNMINFITAMHGRGHAMACNDTEYKMITTLLREAEIDKRFWTLATLARMNVPALQGKIDELVAIRQSEDAFNHWREAFSTALSQIQRIPHDDDRWQEDANAILFSELEPLRLRLQRSTSMSPALTAMHIGASKISIAGAGALAGWGAGGTATSALASSAATTGLESAISYFRAAKSRRQDKAVLDVVLAFQPSVSGS